MSDYALMLSDVEVARHRPMAERAQQAESRQLSAVFVPMFWAIGRREDGLPSRRQ